ncbi:UEV-domain-containing protein [Coprinopsis marcescibilis]|uniref:UEV-domain-containing protein n=1 Tax=Coprinopsis marcescibilis TaxID=230819 RepID=A0A5C3LB37_COPMA|nr:UEV-domain-containing protein [Coprinopsis marcescibilis]
MPDSLSLTQKWLRHNVQPYLNADTVYLDVDHVLSTFPTLRPKSDVYTFDDGRTQLLLCLHGLLPITYRHASYNIPLNIWITRDYPRRPPVVYVVPTADMLIKSGRFLDVSGLCTHEYLQNWQRKNEGCNIASLLQDLQEQFSREPPVYSKPKQSDPPPSQTNQPPPIPNRPPVPHSAITISPPRLPPSPQVCTFQLQPLIPHVHNTGFTPASRPPPPPPPPPPPIPPPLPPQVRHDFYRPGPSEYQPARPTAGFSSANDSPPYPLYRPPISNSPDQSTAIRFSPISNWTPPPPPPVPPQPLAEQRPPPSEESRPKKPIPNLLDDDTQIQSNTPTLAPLPSEHRSAPPRPPNPELLELHRRVHQKLTSELGSLSQALALDADRLRAHQNDLLAGEPAIRDEMARLEAVRDVCRSVADRTRDAVQRAESNVSELRRKGDPEVDELVCATSIVHNQLINLVAEDNAIEDTIYHLHRALNCGRIDLERFLRSTRVLAEEQFTKRALINKIHSGISPNLRPEWA